MSTIHCVSRFLCCRMVCVPGVVLLTLPAGCQSMRHDGGSSAPSWSDKGVIRRVRCLYDQKPWLNLDRAGDRDPEGIRFRVFLDPGTGRGVHKDGTFDIEMYMVQREPDGKLKRELVSDWHYPSSMVHKIAKPGDLGDGYFVYLRWAKKSIAGHEVEIITQFKDENGNIARSGTKRLTVPKYTS